MTLRILTSAGVSPNSGVPIYRVQCSECGEVYRRVGFPWDIKASRAVCDVCRFSAPDAGSRCRCECSTRGT